MNELIYLLSSMPNILWFFVGLILIFLELIVPNFIILFFAIGAWSVSLLLFFVKFSLNIQLIIFLLVSLLSMILLRKYFSNIFHGKESKQQNNDFIGEKAIVTKAIKVNEIGKVEFHGTLWDAEAEDSIDKNERVIILAVQDLILKVRKI
jgi:inner membrane protein